MKYIANVECMGHYIRMALERRPKFFSYLFIRRISLDKDGWKENHTNDLILNLHN